MQLGVNLLLWTGAFSNDQLSLIPKVKRLGFDLVEVPFIALDLIDAGATRQAIQDNGLACTACGVLSPQEDPTSEKPAVRRAGADRLKRMVELAAAIGATVLAGPLAAPVGKLVGRGPTAEERGRALDALAAVAPLAAQAGVRLALEPLNRFETYVVTTVADALDVARSSGDSVGVLLDTFHMNIEEKNAPDAIRLAGYRLFHFHASENDRGIAGTGHVPWVECFQALRDIGYKGAVVIESFVSSVPEIAAATCIWRDLAPSGDALASDSLAFLRRLAGA